MSEFKDDTFLSRWINNELSEEELEAFKKSKNYDAFKKIADGSGLIEPGGFDELEILQKIKENTDQESSPTRSKNKLWVFATAASVAVLFGFFAYTIFFSSDLTTYQTMIGQKMNIELPDGSEVILNANSSLSFLADNWDDKRELSLEGEGYFKVQKGNRFLVKTKSGDVEVLGTEFTIKELDDFFEVLCYEGSVKVSSLDEEEILKPKTGVRRTRGSALLRRNILLNQPSWLSNKSTFTSVPMSYVLIELKNQYGVQFEGRDVLEELSFNGTFPHDNLDLALKIVLDPINIKYEKKGNVIVLSKD
ncbi:FecR family protein [Ekhidna sp. To15]|uniref:FecR family protein n=1 Tax=Ekhidna sp. To15 TaxID=3395267 RepID=UPI003F5277E1